jgi:hypothetical protein
LPRRPASTAARVRAWYASGGQRILVRLSASLNAVAAADQAAAGGSLAGMTTACSSLTGALTAAEAATPIPDHNAAKWFARALARHQQGAADCQAGIQATDPSLITKAATVVLAGTRDLRRASKAIKALDG